MAGDEPGDKRPLLIVARGQRSLLEAVRELFAELGGVDVIEDQGPSLLSREDRSDNLSEQVAVQRLFPAPPWGRLQASWRVTKGEQESQESKEEVDPRRP
jgi:hypothetical protein